MPDQTNTDVERIAATIANAMDMRVGRLEMDAADAAPYDAGDAPTARRLPTRDEYLATTTRISHRSAAETLAAMYVVRDQQAAEIARLTEQLDNAEHDRDQLAEALERAETVRIDRYDNLWRPGPDGWTRHRVGNLTEQQLDEYHGPTRAALLLNIDDADQAAALGSPPDRAQGPTVAELLRQAAAGRREYARNIPEKAELLDLQASTLDGAARVADGDLGPLYNWLPSWRWTDEMVARLHARHPADGDRAQGAVDAPQRPTRPDAGSREDNATTGPHTGAQAGYEIVARRLHTGAVVASVRIDQPTLAHAVADLAAAIGAPRAQSPATKEG